jgi:cytoskeletal protein CcmA (bactofilin family)
MNLKQKVGLLILSLIVVCGVGFGFVSTAKAVEFDDDGTISAEEVIDDDLFIASDTVEINGTVKGDVFAAGGLVKVNGTIEGSLAAGAQTIIIDGDVMGSVYAGASTFTLDDGAVVKRNVFFGGFNLTTEKGSSIGRDLLVGAYQALLSGQIERDVRAGVGALEINGTVGGDVYAEVGSPEDNQQTIFFGGPPGVDTIVPTGIRISEEAQVGGKVTYKSSQNQEDAIQISPLGGIDFQFDPRLENGDTAREVGIATLVGSWFVKRLRDFITLLILGALVIWQLPSLLQKVSETAKAKTGSSLGWGIVTLIVVYVSAFIIAGLIIAGGLFFGVITLGGLSRSIFSIGFSSLGLALAVFGLLVSYVSKLVISFTVGKLILQRMAPTYTEQLAWPMILGILIYVILRALPFFLGWLIGALVTLTGIGAMWLAYRDRQLQPVEETT